MTILIHEGPPPARKPQKWQHLKERIAAMPVGDHFGAGAPDGVTVDSVRTQARSIAVRHGFKITTYRVGRTIWITRRA